MQFLKLWLVRCAAVLCLCAISARAVDTDAQIKAREALRQKIDELQSQSGSPATPPPVETAPPAANPEPVKKPAKRKEKPTPPPVETPRVVEPPSTRPTPPAATSVAPPSKKSKRSKDQLEQKSQPAASPWPTQTQSSAAGASDPAAIAKAREAVRQKMSELQAQPEPAQPSVPPAVVAAPPKPEKPKPVAVVKKEKPVPTQTRATQQVTKPEAGTREVRAQAQPASKPQKLSAAQTQTVSYSRYKPIQGPASSLPAEKESRLADLLRRYQADEITPNQYHEERAKILAAP